MQIGTQSGVLPDESVEPAQSAPVGAAVRVLGSLRVVVGGAERDPGPPRSRTVLALLVAKTGSVVSVEQLIDGIWGDDPPATAKKAVHVHVSKLRRALGDDFPLLTAPGGYVVPAVSVDAVRFEELATHGTRLLRTDPGAASNVLADALGLWDGPAYADLADEPALGAEISRLDEVRLQVVEHRLDADLRLGRHSELVGELEALTVDHPFRERFRELHMLALYRCGRQAEALRAYEHTRVRLADELGLDPSPALQELQHRILDQSEVLDLEESGTERYAFLATDLEDSTALWENETESMQLALVRHDEILERAVGDASGRIFKHIGDGVLAVFATFSDAAHAAMHAQAMLDAERWSTSRPLRVRMAVDEGAATRRGDDFFGPAMNRVNRIMASGHGGQVLLPAALAAASSLETVPLGAADYRGLGRVDVAQLVIDGVPVDFPELRTERTAHALERPGFGRSIRGYELRERLGEGAHGHVYRAYQASIGREVAVKVIRPEFANRTDFIKRFEAEAQFVAQLEHPHIVSLYDYWRDRDGAYLVMQLLRGGSLAATLERSPWGPPTGTQMLPDGTSVSTLERWSWGPPAALQVLDQIGVALDYAHRHGVVHRDLKPSNVLLDAEGNAYLSDFGIAVEHLDAVSVPVESSAAYVSPEELAGQPLGTPADVYGLGVLTYELLTGDRPPLGAQPPRLCEQRHDLPVALDDVLARATDPDPSARYARIDDYLRAVRQAVGTDVVTPRRAGSDAAVRNPFKGLRAFGETDARDFFGRAALTSELIERVRTERITAVVGPSGCGKSSLVRAGLLPAVRRGALGDADVLITEMFPGTYPFEELEAALSRVGVQGDGGTLADLDADDRGLVRVSKQILPDDDSELLLVIDQFEELFSLTTDEQTRRRFLANLVTVVNDERSRVRLVVTMRADFLDRPLATGEFGALLGSALLPVATPTREELAEVISRPATAAGIEFEAGLVPRIVGDVVDQPGALPLLQYALTEMVFEGDSEYLTSVGYERIGGVSGALATRAEEIYAGLTEPVRDVARDVFLRLVSVGDDADDTRRRVRRSELASLGLPERALDHVLDAYGSFRLLSFDRDPVTRGPTIEVAHEALIREWPRYRGWIDERREDLLLERRLDAAVADWQSNDRDRGFLVAGGRLEQFERWVAQGEFRLTDDERDFLANARDAEDDRNRSTARRRRRVLVTVSALALVAAGLAVVAFIQRNDAEEKAALAAAEAARAIEQEEVARDAVGDAAASRAAEVAARLNAEQSALESAVRSMALSALTLSRTDQEAAMLLAIQASEVGSSSSFNEVPEVTRALIETTAANHLVQRVDVRPLAPLPLPMHASFAVGPESERVVALVRGDDGPDRVAAIVALGTGDVDRRFDDVESPSSVFWDRERDEVLVGAADGEVSIWNPHSGERVGSFPAGGTDPLIFETVGDFVGYSVEEPPSETGVVSRRVIVTDRVTGERVVDRADADVVRLSPGGDLAVVTDRDGTMYVHDLPTGATRWERPSEDRTASASFDFVSGEDAIWLSGNGVLSKVDLATGEPTAFLDRGALQFSSPTASPDGRWVASSGLGSEIDVYAVDGLGEPDAGPEFELRSGDEVVSAVDWLPDGSGLISLNQQGEAVLWDLSGRLSFPARIPLDDSALKFEFLDQDRLSLSGALHGAHLLDLESESSGAVNGTGSVATTDVPDVLSPVEPLLARSLGSGVGLEVRDLESGDEVIALTEFDRPIAFSPAGDRLLVSTTEVGVESVDGTAGYAVFDVDSGRAVFTVENAFARGAAFAPDGAHVIVARRPARGETPRPGTAPSALVVHDAESGVEVGGVDLDYEPSAAIEVSADSRLLASGGLDGELVLYDVDALLDNQPTAEIVRTSLPAEVLAIGITRRGQLTARAPTERGAVVVASVVGVGGVSAFDAEYDLARSWRVDSGVQVVDIELHDDLIWIPAFDDTGFGLVGLHDQHLEAADFARSRATRALTPAECEAHVGVPCPTKSAYFENFELDD